LVTRAIANAADDVDVGELVAERRRMGEELRAFRQADAGKVAPIGAVRRLSLPASTAANSFAARRMERFAAERRCLIR
jgi:hypothetical protein